VPRRLRAGQGRHALGEEQQAEQRELGQRHAVHAGRRGEDKPGSGQPGPVEEPADPGAGPLDPAQPWAVGHHVRGRLPVEVEAHVGLPAQRGPGGKLGRGQLAWHPGVVRRVTRHRQQAGLVEHGHAGVRRLDPGHVLWLERGGDQDAQLVICHRVSAGSRSIVDCQRLSLA